MVTNIPWDATPMPPLTLGQWLAQKEKDGSVNFIYPLQQANLPVVTLYKKETNKQLALLGDKQRPPARSREVRVIRTFGPKNIILDYNPQDDTTTEQASWLWGNNWITELQWDPKDWKWRRLGILPDTSILNYTTKRGYRVALRQDNNQMQVDAKLEPRDSIAKLKPNPSIEFGIPTSLETSQLCNAWSSLMAYQWEHGERK
jgi:hypothetical protein